MDLIKLRSVVRTYGKGENIVHALRNINLSIKSGEFVAIMGPSGSGKTTLLNILGCLDSADSGSYELEGREITDTSEKELAKIRNANLGFVVQSFELLNDYTVYENIKIPLEYSDKKIKNKKEKVMGILKELDLLDKLNKYPTELSGGQCQRIAIARALINEPKIILADEPTGALDKRTGNEVMNIFKDINKGGTTIILVTHDINIASQCHRIINIEDGFIVNDIKNS
ncbi:ABC transporter ATP-binding protein [Clostridium perfringens]|uniref:ABC transporter ATP-binding protein n=1 Tax=Clostridium perfringens TaxID=1502 RepID=UPI000D9975B9|nr:ABC transporter ATP-binding protein [Clostridium perfringens]EJT5924732.1 ABC transporter ATP-binding protein [Clostridium perfringens]MDM0445501.1 ABC transporter ATP-binding protein [Clostridium perfringens]MDM0450624.1 ABC transporter ATP-binding protein [Clostridium perfringens]UBK60174.1 ABC transporter ATP-binding protein [Clostridium perfringens]SQB25093.1 transporter [Clostridium perfringens]